LSEQLDSLESEQLESEQLDSLESEQLESEQLDSLESGQQQSQHPWALPTDADDNTGPPWSDTITMVGRQRTSPAPSCLSWMGMPAKSEH